MGWSIFYSVIAEDLHNFKQGVPNEKIFSVLHHRAWRRDRPVFTGRFRSVYDRHAKIDKVLSRYSRRSDHDSHRRGCHRPRQTYRDHLVLYILHGDDLSGALVEDGSVLGTIP